MRQLTTEQIESLKACKGVEGGKEKYFDILSEIYADDSATLAEINQCREMFDSLDTIDFPAARDKTQHMYYKYMDSLLVKVGFYK